MEENNKYQNIESETDFREIARNPMRWYGLVFPFFIVIIVIGGLYFISNMGTFYTNNIKPLADNPEIKKQPLQLKRGVILEGVDIMEISKPSQDMISQGRELYQANCASCHGENGRGDGIAGATLNPPPKDFTNTDEWVNGPTIADMYKTLEEGIAGGGMVAYDYLPVRDRFAMIHYIRTFADDYPQNTEEELAQLNQTYSLAEGKETSNVIPMELAIDKILAENAEFLKNLSDVEIRIEADNTEEAVLFKSYASDYKKVITLLSKDMSWQNDADIFRKILFSGVPYNGIKPRIADLKENELIIMQSYLGKIINLIVLNSYVDNLSKE